MPWSIKAVNVPAASSLLVGGDVRVFGWSFHESSGTAAAHLRLWDGGAASGTLLNPVSLSSDQSTRDWLGPHGIRLSVGLYYEKVDGAVEGSVWVGAWEDDEPVPVYLVQGWRRVSTSGGSTASAVGTVQGVGTGSGTDYTTASTSFVRVDATNLSKPIAAAAGDVLQVTLSGVCGGATNILVTAVGINGVVASPGMRTAQTGNSIGFSSTWQYTVQAGDVSGGTVTVDFMFRAFSGGTADIVNSATAHDTVPVIAVVNLKH